jgi:hypothetical protein
MPGNSPNSGKNRLWGRVTRVGRFGTIPANGSFSRSDSQWRSGINDARQRQSDILISVFKVPKSRQIGGFRFFGTGQQRHGDQHRRASGCGGHHAPGDTPNTIGAIFSGLGFLNRMPINASAIHNTVQHVLSSAPVTKGIQTALHDPQLLQAVEQIANDFDVHDDALDELLADLGIE